KINKNNAIGKVSFLCCTKFYNFSSHFWPKNRMNECIFCVKALKTLLIFLASFPGSRFQVILIVFLFVCSIQADTLSLKNGLCMSVAHHLLLCQRLCNDVFLNKSTKTNDLLVPCLLATFLTCRFCLASI